MGKLWLIFAAVLAADIVFIKADIGNPPPDRTAKIGNFTIEQKLNHFTKYDNRTFQMHYTRNDEFFQPNGPLFIFFNGKDTLFKNFSSSHMFHMAKEHNGSFISTDHRFYGKSQLSKMIASGNRKYLTAQQALADLAHLIRQLKISPLCRKSKVILAGGGYAGSLVVWFKKLYPDLVDGVWASNPFLLAKADFSGYREAVGQSIKMIGGDACYNRIKHGFAELESMFANKRGSEAKTMLRLCSSFNETNDLDVSALFYYNFQFFLWETSKIKEHCNTLMKAPSDFTGVFNFFVNTPKGTCRDITYETYIYSFFVDFPSSKLFFMYQQCNEFGWFETSSSRDQPFGAKNPLQYFIIVCADLFGDKFTSEYINKRTKETNKIFGGLTPNVKNVYITFGEFEVTKFLDKQLVEGSTIIPNATSYNDLDLISDKDSPELRASKEKIAALVRKWLA